MDNDENYGHYCENCHIAVGLCECKDCDECIDYRGEPEDTDRTIYNAKYIDKNEGR